ncbi:hypothetical protein LTR37_018808 [Vermiconidia calcicola]|uniref:Uncharacterized protein n=1 Tax=Vermiconidia calcicola TaxID=1690605 RepID=A0ACC3MGA6_9PEZI|nr:hypothetical protein LTR37_018808 [Vermiconidia calcicola]
MSKRKVQEVATSSSQYIANEEEEWQGFPDDEPEFAARPKRPKRAARPKEAPEPVERGGAITRVVRTDEEPELTLPRSESREASKDARIELEPMPLCGERVEQDGSEDNFEGSETVDSDTETAGVEQAGEEHDVNVLPEEGTDEATAGDIDQEGEESEESESESESEAGSDDDRYSKIMASQAGSMVGPTSTYYDSNVTERKRKDADKIIERFWGDPMRALNGMLIPKYYDFRTKKVKFTPYKDWESRMVMELSGVARLADVGIANTYLQSKVMQRVNKEKEKKAGKKGSSGRCFEPESLLSEDVTSVETTLMKLGYRERPTVTTPFATPAPGPAYHG